MYCPSFVAHKMICIERLIAKGSYEISLSMFTSFPQKNSNQVVHLAPSYSQLNGLVVTIGADLAILIWMDITLSPNTKHLRLLVECKSSHIISNRINYGTADNILLYAPWISPV